MTKQKSPEILRLKQLLNEIGLDLSDIAAETGVSERTIKNFLWNDMPIGGQFLRRLQQCYGVSIDWLLSGAGAMFIDRRAPHPRDPLVPSFDFVDTANAQDVFIVAAAAIEQSLMQCGAVPEEDYSLLDLFNLAQPFALDKYKENGNDLSFFG